MSGQQVAERSWCRESAKELGLDAPRHRWVMRRGARRSDSEQMSTSLACPWREDWSWKSYMGGAAGWTSIRNSAWCR